MAGLVIEEEMHGEISKAVMIKVVMMSPGLWFRGPPWSTIGLQVTWD